MPHLPTPAEAFCSPFDEALAASGPPAVFLRDRDGEWRFDAKWTRDVWGRVAAPVRTAARYAHAVDVATGYVQIVLCTGPTLLDPHPRLRFRWFDDFDAAWAAYVALGRPPLDASSPEAT